MDGNETFSTKTKDKETGVTVNITGEGNVAATVSVNNSSEGVLQTDTVRSVSASPAYEFEAGANFTSANITLPYNGSKVADANESALGAYRYNETLQTFVPVNNSAVDTENDTVTAETPHFSTYTVLDSKKWESRFEKSLPDKWSNEDNFSDLDEWAQDGNVSAQLDTVESASSFAARQQADDDRNGTVVVGSVVRQSERNWTKPTGNETDENDTQEVQRLPDPCSGTLRLPDVPDDGDECDDSDPITTTTTEETTTTTTTTEETTEEEATTEDTSTDSDGDGTDDSNDDCPTTPGEDGGCPEDSDGDGTKDYDDDCDYQKGEGDSCPTDSDNDDTINYHDDCPNSPGEGDDGCAVHSDKDDHQDYFDDCPDEPGEGPNGCPEDDDGDNTRNFHDQCPQFPGWKSNGCPRESELERTITLRDAETVTVSTIAKANAVSNRSVAKLVVIGPDGNRVEVYGEEKTQPSTSEADLGAQAVLPGGGDRTGFDAVERDISQFAGQQVTIKIVTVGRATFEINALRLGYDTDGDGFFDAVERGTCGLRDGTGQCLDTDPRLADTDGDGLSDSYEVGPREKVHGHVYQSLVSNPTVRDTDHDGLSDAKEVQGSYRISVTRSPKASRGYLNGQSPGDKHEHLTETPTDSDPLTIDTDNDGLSDRQEWLYKTDARKKDSDGDGLLDSRERAIGADPTLHDYRGPDIRVAKHGYVANYSQNTIRYILGYLVFDASGVEQTRVRKNSKTRYRATPNEILSRHNGTFTVSGLSAIGDHLAGAKVEVTATDQHGNRESKVGIRKPNAFGELASKLDEDTLYAKPAAAKLGQLSGLSAGLGGTIKSVLGLVNDPLGFVKGFGNLVEMIDRAGLGLVSMFLDAMVSDLQDKQKTNNPYSEGSELYDEYRYNWYAGYTIAFITKAIAGAQATKVIKGSDLFDKVSSFAKSTRTGKAVMRVKAPYDRGKARVATGLVRAGGKASGPLLRRAKSAGATYRLWRLQRKAEVDTSDLSEVERDRVTAYLAKHGEDGAETLRRMDDDDVKALFRKTCGGVGTFGRAGGDGCNVLSDEEQEGFEDIITEPDIKKEKIDEYLSKFDDPTTRKNIKEFIAENGPAAAHLTRRLDEDALKQLAKLGDGSQEALLRAWRADSDVDAGDVKIVLHRYGDVDSDGQLAFRRSLTELDEHAQAELVRSFASTEYPNLFTSGLSKLRNSDDGALKEFYRFEAGKAAKARRAVLVNVGLDADITPARAYQFADDVRALRSNPDVEGVEKVVNHIAIFDGVETNVIKGDMFEIRFTKYYLDTHEVPDGTTIRMDYNLDGSIDIGESLAEETKVKIIREIELPNSEESKMSAGYTKESLTEAEKDLYDEEFTGNTQLDMATITKSDGSQDWIYLQVGQ